MKKIKILLTLALVLVTTYTYAEEEPFNIRIEIENRAPHDAEVIFTNSNHEETRAHIQSGTEGFFNADTVDKNSSLIIHLGEQILDLSDDIQYLEHAIEAKSRRFKVDSKYVHFKRINKETFSEEALQLDAGDSKAIATIEPNQLVVIEGQNYRALNKDEPSDNADFFAAYDHQEKHQMFYSGEDKVLKITLDGKKQVMSIDLEKVRKEKLAPYFYEVKRKDKGLEKPVYLLGTCHTLSPNDYNEALVKRIEATDVLISEFPKDSEDFKKSINEEWIIFNEIYNRFINLDLYWFRDQLMGMGFSQAEVEDALKILIKEHKKLKNGETSTALKNALNEEELAFLEKLSQEHGIDLLAMHPRMIFILLSIISESYSSNDDEEKSLEAYMIKSFKDSGKPIYYLDDRKSLMWGYLYDEFIIELDTIELIEHIKLKVKKFRQCPYTYKYCWTIADYLGTIDETKEMILPNWNEDSKIEAIESFITLKARNEYWQATIKQALGQDVSAVFITGAAHLPGRYGIIAQLEALGYEVVRVRL